MIRETRAGLEGSRCRVCGRAACPPQMAHCGEPTEAVRVRPVGTIEAWSVARVAPERFEAPYAFGYVRLHDGPRVFVRLADWSDGDVREGDPVVVSLEEVGRSPRGPLRGLVARRQAPSASNGETR